MKRYLVFSAAVAVVLCQIEFPELPTQRLDSEDTAKRVPLYAPKKCPENQLLYPGDQEHDWICDCAPGYIYYPPKDGCFAAYHKGPCSKGEHLTINRGEVIPECVPNPCQDGFAIYNGTCYELGKPNGPCRPLNEGGGIFDVNATTLEVQCLKGTDRLSLFNIPSFCTPGSKRDSNGNCRPKIPFHAPDKCPENQLLFPGDQEDDWICDCRPGYIYYPTKDGCFAAYRQGPCKNGEYLIIRKGEVVPQCAPNPCEDGFAKYNGKCYEMGKPNGPCCPSNENGGIFYVNPTTLRVKCLIRTSNFSLFSTPSRCHRNARRNKDGRYFLIYDDYILLRRKIFLLT